MKTAIGLSQLAQFDSIIDVRSPTEFELDHIPGAVNFPVLDDTERAEIGTVYKQVSAFEAKKRGAALVAKNIARHLLDPYISGRERLWRPLVYCWRGGKRSAAMAHVLREIGWNAMQLEGGYKTYRGEVMRELAVLPLKFSYRVVCGETGSGKSRLLRALVAAGAQVLDLEAIARHRGSVLGNLPDAPQPSQKAFDSSLWDALAKFDPTKPLFIEAESKKIGVLRLPEALVRAMWKSPCLRLELGFEQRVALLLDEYAHFFSEPALLCEKLDGLKALHGAAVIDNWRALVRAGNWPELAADLLTRHYDPLYRRSTARNYPQLADCLIVRCADAGETALRHAAEDILKSLECAESPA